MRSLTIVSLFFSMLLGCKTKQQTPSGSGNAPMSNLVAYKDYKANPDEVVLKLKQIGVQENQGDYKIIIAEVVDQLKAGFSANVLLSSGDSIKVKSKSSPYAEEFICSVIMRPQIGKDPIYIINRYLK